MAVRVCSHCIQTFIFTRQTSLAAFRSVISQFPVAISAGRTPRKGGRSITSARQHWPLNTRCQHPLSHRRLAHDHRRVLGRADLSNKSRMVVPVLEPKMRQRVRIAFHRLGSDSLITSALVCKKSRTERNEAVEIALNCDPTIKKSL
jgi:hypothetical protein